MDTIKTHIYFIPGLAASSKIFEYLQLPEDKYVCHYLEWLVPTTANESISDYALRLCEKIKNNNPVLIGVSFGGLIVQEMARHIKTRAVVIISSVKSENEFPKRVGFAKFTGIYKLFPSKYISQMERLAKLSFGEKIKKRIELYEKYLSVTNSTYLNWAFYTILHWKKEYQTLNLYHLHGDADMIFPAKYISNYTAIKNGSHIMILTKAKKISEILQEIV